MYVSKLRHALYHAPTIKTLLLQYSTSSTGGEGNPPTTTTNPRGIPSAPFIDKVETYVSSRSQVESTLRSFQEMISKYQFMELNTQRRAAGLKDKIPEMQRSLNVVRFLKQKSNSALRSESELDAELEAEAEAEAEGQRRSLQTTFSLNDTLYAKAEIELPLQNQEVYLWLGANVMLAYPVDEAESMLVEKLDGAKRGLDACEEDLDFLREQVTVCLFAFFLALCIFFWEGEKGVLGGGFLVVE